MFIQNLLVAGGVRVQHMFRNGLKEYFGTSFYVDEGLLLPYLLGETYHDLLLTNIEKAVHGIHRLQGIKILT